MHRLRLAPLLLLVACLGADGPTVPFLDPQPAYRAFTTLGGFTVHVPEPLWPLSDLPAVLQEVDAVNPPQGWTVRIRTSQFWVPHALSFSLGSPPEGRWARGSTSFASREIQVGWRCPGGSGTFLPGLPWEARLARLPEDQAAALDRAGRRR